MKITPIKIYLDKVKFELGTGKSKGLEVYPCTISLLNRLNVEQNTINDLIPLQNKTLTDLPDIPSINNLREYQKEDVKFLAARKAAACFNEQRTGKTPTSLSTMKIKGVTKLLIIAPASTLYTWAKECKTWWFEGLPVIVVDGAAHKRKKLIEEWKTGALIISYECLRETIHKVKDDFGELIELEVNDSGNINSTYIATFLDFGGVYKRYLVQRINTSVFTEPYKLMKNIEGVTAYLKKQLEKELKQLDKAIKLLEEE